MVVHRMVIRSKPGRMNDVVELLIGERGKDTVKPMRIFTCNIGPSNVAVACEITFEDMGDYEKSWAEWAALPDTPEYMEKWYKCVDDWSDEIWNVVD
jgi:hypothetical protein